MTPWRRSRQLSGESIPLVTTRFQTDDQHESWGYWDIKVAPRETQTVTVTLDVAVPKDFQFSW